MVCHSPISARLMPVKWREIKDDDGEVHRPFPETTGDLFTRSVATDIGFCVSFNKVRM